MLKSMTGYGRTGINYNGKNYNLEVRALNGKVLDINARIPNHYRVKEMEIRKLLSKSLIRGKIDITISAEQLAAKGHQINEQLFNEYHKQLKTVTQGKQLDQTHMLPAILNIPNVVYAEVETLENEEWQAVKQAIASACEQVDNYRLQEGETIKLDFSKKVEAIAHLLDGVEESDDNRIARIRERIEGNITQILGEEGYDGNRLEQELIYYLEKLDINEEKQRLRANCDFFKDVLAETGYEKGKKLSFITQEIGREINTLGSKAADAKIQREVVLMKDNLEKIKEQIANVL